MKTQTEHIPVVLKSRYAEDQKFTQRAAVVPSETDAPVKGVVMMGLGSEGRLVERAARLAAVRGLVDVMFVQGLKYYKGDPREMMELAVQSTQAAASHARTRLGANVLHGLGESQNGPAVLETALQDPEAIDGSIVLVHSLGTVALTRGQFAGRMLRSGMQKDQFHLAAPAIVAHSLHRLGQDALRRGDRRMAQLDFALGYQAVPRLAALRAEQPERQAYVVAGENDYVFPPDEQAKALAVYDVVDMLHLIDNASHSTPASPAGARQIELSAQLWKNPNALPKFSVAN